MEKEKKARAIKMLQAELKDEKEAEMKRRREVTKERKQAAEERRRLEEDKAKVCRENLLLYFVLINILDGRTQSRTTKAENG